MIVQVSSEFVAEYRETVAADAGRADALAVAAGRMTEEEAGDRWVAYADRSYEQGEAYLKAYRQVEILGMSE